MEAALTTLGSILIKCGLPICGSLNLSADHVIKFRSNLEALDRDFRFLQGKKNQILADIEVAEKDGKKRTVEISMWLVQLQEIEPRVTTILGQDLSTCCFNCSSRYKLSDEVAEKLALVTRLMGLCNPPYTMDAPVEAVQQLPGPSIKDQETAAKNLNIILEHLQNDRVGILGMLGMGGIGKTTLIRNLNNELESFNKEQEIKGSGRQFSVVIWVTVSKLNLEDVQNQIAHRLKMPKVEGENVEQKATRLFHRLKMEKRFIVILDDMWKRIELEKIGIPNPKNHVGSKVILTTRKQEVCREMEADVKFQVITLSEQESWNLFKEKAGDVIESYDVQSLAKSVVKECGGLPLALITVGWAMRGKDKIGLWEHALTTLKMSSPDPNIEKELFYPLKLSYDSLEGNNIKPCFLYCCLYPEDFAIEVNELIQNWVAEGLIDEEEDYKLTYNRGIVLIENLKESCLLEWGNQEGTVRMHDVVRDIAVWIANSSEDGCKSFIRSGGGLRQIPRAQTWESCRRVSFMYNKIEMLPDSVTQCSKVSTLLLQGNAQLRKIPFGFLQGFLALRVLNFSETNIISLPPVERLGELRGLFLRSCPHLQQFPPLRGLSRLQVLDLSGTRMNLSPDEAALKLKELNFQDHLLEFYVDLKYLPSISARDSDWLRKLGRFRIRIGPTIEEYPTPHNERVVHLCDISSSSEAVLVFWSNASALVLIRCQCINDMWAGYSDVTLDNLKSLTVDDCSWPGSMVTDNAQHDLVLLPNLEVLSLLHVRNLPSISQIVVQFGTKIKIIEITRCHGLKQLFPLESLHKLESLEKICVKSCHNLIEVVVDSAAPTNILPRLRTIELKDLPKLTSICRQARLWPCLTHIEVKDCPLLRQLPLSASCANTIAAIKGEVDWWNKLQWDNEDTKLNLKDHFKQW